MNKELKILVIDDEVLIAEHISDILKKLGFKRIKMAHDAKEALSLITGFEPQLVLLDIHMEDEETGLRIGKQLKEKYFIPFIFITANADPKFISRAVETKPYGYITKPVRPADLFASINVMLTSAKEDEEEMFVFKDGYDLIKVKTTDVLFAEAEGNYIHLTCKDKKYTLRHSLEWLKEQLPGDNFMRVHRSYLVNISEVQKQSAGQLYIREYKIPVSRGLTLKIKNKLS